MGKNYRGDNYWLVTELGDGAVTIIRKEGGSGKRNAVRGGELYEFVKRVNQEIMEQEKTTQ